MIDFDKLELNISEYKDSFNSSQPYEHLIIDDFCLSDKVHILADSIPDPIDNNFNQSRDFIFAKGKYEKSDFSILSSELAELYNDLISSRFNDFLSALTGFDLFVDPDFHGGGLHQASSGSYLNMHADFNYHPVHKNWFRNVNILLYLNKNWDPSFGGHLKMRNSSKSSEETFLAEPLFNRAIIMYTRDNTLHGYDPISFPPGTYRTIVAAYAYNVVDKPHDIARTTVWYPDSSNSFVNFLGRNIYKLVKLKNKFLGSSTTKNK